MAVCNIFDESNPELARYVHIMYRSIGYKKSLNSKLASFNTHNVSTVTIMNVEDPILEAVRKGLPLSDEIIVDSHNHLGLYNQYYVPFSDHAVAADELIKHFDRIGVYKGCIWSMGGQTADFVPLNDLIIDAVKKYPDRLIGYTFVNPNYPEIMREELERCYKQGLRGIKLIPSYHNYPDNGENLHIAYQFANEHSLPMHIHNLPDAPVVDKLAAQYDNAVFQIGHYGREYSEVVKKRENVYGILTTQPYSGVIEQFLSDGVVDKVLLGSDCVYFDATFGIGIIAYARISYEDKQKLLGLNAKRILDRCGLWS
jgi:predicted TIM-barrel fold metal-dependent hydrolase